MLPNKFYIAILTLIILNILALFCLLPIFNNDMKLVYKPLISVVVTSYNYDKYIEKNLKSILNQTYKNYEVIIVEDGSSDKSIDIIKKYTNKYKNFHLYTHPYHQNKGLVESVKLGISKASGEYIAFLESDDYWHKDNLYEKVKMINKYKDAVFIVNNVKPFGNDEAVKIRNQYIERINYTLFKEKNIIPPLELTEFNIIPTFSCVMIKKDVLQALNFDTTIPQFLDFWLYRQILLFYNLYYIRTPLTYWRQHNSYNSLDKFEKLYDKLGDFIKENNKILYEYI